MRKFLNDILTGLDGKTIDAARVFMAGGCGAMLVGAGMAIWHGTFDPVTFGSGYGGLMVGAGGSIWLKRDTEPKGADQ